MGDTWLKLYRSLLKKPIWRQSTPEQKVILITILMMVNYLPADWEWNGEIYTCQPGQRVTSLETIAAECGKGISIQNVRTALKRFEKLGFLTNESTKTGRLITVANWEKYQGGEDEPNKEANKDLTKTQQRGNKDLTPREESKKDKKDRKKEIYKGLPPELQITVDDFLEMRRRIKAPATDRALELMLKKLDGLSGGDTGTAVKILEQSIERGWKTVYPLKDDSKLQGVGYTPQPNIPKRYIPPEPRKKSGMPEDLQKKLNKIF